MLHSGPFMSIFLISCMWKNADQSKNTVSGSVNHAPAAPVAGFHIRVQSVHKHLQITSPSLSTAPLEHAVTHFIVRANRSSSRLLFANVPQEKKQLKTGSRGKKMLNDSTFSLVLCLLMRKC